MSYVLKRCRLYKTICSFYFGALVGGATCRCQCYGYPYEYYLLHTIFGYSKFEVESSAFLNEKKNLISNFEVENCYNPILRNFALWLKTANVIASWNLLNTCIDTE